MPEDNGPDDAGHPEAGHLEAGRLEAGRLEAALDRIARAALPDAHRAPTTTPPPNPRVAARLDNLIAELRAVLGTDA